MEMPEKETLDKVLDYKLNYQDNETLEKVRTLYDMSTKILSLLQKNPKPYPASPFLAFPYFTPSNLSSFELIYNLSVLFNCNLTMR